MSLFGGVVPVLGISFLMFCILVIAGLGYALGRISVKGVQLGTAGVFIVALIFGALFYNYIDAQLTVKIPAISQADGLAAEAAKSYASNALKIVENLGLIMFVTAVGFIAGPNFFKNLKKNFKSYILLGVIIILAGGLTCVACYFIGRGWENDPKEFVAMLVGILSGALTSTPAFSAAKATVAPQYEDAVTVGHGIAYLFGVIGVVLFVQLIPKILKANMDEERQKLMAVDTGEVKGGEKRKLFSLDNFGIGVFSIAAVLGILVGAIKIPLTSRGLAGTAFSLTTTGGALIVSLLFGHFGHIGKLNIMPEKKTLEVFRELGLMLFLIGAGIAGGANFVKYFKPAYFLYGVAMTLVPLIIGFIFAKFVLKLSLLNNLGSITGGMTSTPALGTLIGVAKTDDVASAYAATYPISLISVVLVSQFIILLL